MRSRMGRIDRNDQSNIYATLNKSRTTLVFAFYGRLTIRLNTIVARNCQRWKLCIEEQPGYGPVA